jgi:hypothetical protein
MKTDKTRAKNFVLSVFIRFIRGQTVLIFPALTPTVEQQRIGDRRSILERHLERHLGVGAK